MEKLGQISSLHRDLEDWAVLLEVSRAILNINDAVC